MVLGMCPAWAIAEETDVEPGDEAVVEVQDEGDGDVAEEQGGDDDESQMREMILTAQAAEDSESFQLSGVEQSTFTGTHFTITGDGSTDTKGLLVNKNSSVVTISSLDGTIITRIEFGVLYTGSLTLQSTRGTVSVEGFNGSVSGVNDTSLILSSSNGLGYVNSVTVYYEAHSHSWGYSADGATITANCTTDCPVGAQTATLSLNKTSFVYGETITPTVTVSDGWKTANGLVAPPAATDGVYVNQAGTADYNSSAVPTDVGGYTAQLEVEGQPAPSAKVDFEIAKAGQDKLDDEEARKKSGIDYEDETVSPDKDVEVSPTNSPTEDDDAPGIPSLAPILDAGGDPVIYVRRKAPDDSQKPSEWTAVPLAPRPPAPTGLTTEPATDGQ